MNARPTETTVDGTGAQPGAERATDGPLAGSRARTAAAALGGGLVIVGLQRRSLPGLLLLGAGAALLARTLREEPRVDGVVDAQVPDAVDAATPDDPSGDGPGDVRAVRRSVTVGRSADELYEMWRDPEQFSRIVGHVADVTAAGDDRHRWTVRGPLDRAVTWETRVVDEEPGEFLRWESTADATVPTTGTVRFRPAPDDRGTEVELTVDVDPPGGRLGAAALRRLDVVPSALAGTALHRFEALAETGEIPTLEGNPSARGSGDRL